MVTIKKTTTPDASAAENKQIEMNQRPFTKINFYMMAGCLALIIIGFALMSGGGTDDPTAFNPEIFSTRRIVVGPALSFLGFLLMAFAIIYTPKNKKGDEVSAQDADAAVGEEAQSQE